MPTTKSPKELIKSRLQEGGFIVGCALAIFLFVALLTYNQADPGWSHAVSGEAIFNSAGTVGAWAADVLLYFFGYVAYIVPVLVTIAAALFYKNYHRHGLSKLILLLHSIGLFLVVASSCGLFDLVVLGPVYGELPGPTGGIVGSLLCRWSVPRFSFFGSYTIFLTTFMVGITVGTGVSWVRLLELLGKFILATLFSGCAVVKAIIAKLPRSLPSLPSMPRLRRSVAVEPAASYPLDEPVQKNVVQKPEVTQSKVSKPLIPLKKVDQLPLQNNKTKKHTNSAKKTSSEFPDLNLLDPVSKTDTRKHYSMEDLEKLSREVEKRLQDFGVSVKVVAVCPGPIITRFEMTLAPGMKVSKITGLAKDLARSLSVTSVRVVEVIPGKSVVGLEIPNRHREIVNLREVFESEQFQDKDGVLSLALGKDISGLPVVVNLARMPHLLVAGTTGSGKSVGVNAMLLSLLFKASPEDLKLLLIDPKMLELSIYDGIGHLLTPVVTDMNDAANALRWCVAEMERRYQLMAALGVRNLAGYNSKVLEAEAAGKPLTDPLWNVEAKGEAPEISKLPYIVVIIDEFADMMMVVGKKVEELIARIAQKARAAGIHMILATQRPSVDVITGLIKANVPTRIAFQVSSRIDSRTILDQQGAEQLLGHGDMLYLAPGTGIPTRVHGAFVSDQEVHNVVNAIKEHLPAPEYIEDISADSAVPGIDPVDESGEQDPMYDEAVAIVVESRKASISYLQRRLKIGYNRSARLIEAMEAAGLVTEMLPNGTREIKV